MQRAPELCLFSCLAELLQKGGVAVRFGKTEELCNTRPEQDGFLGVFFLHFQNITSYQRPLEDFNDACCFNNNGQSDAAHCSF